MRRSWNSRDRVAVLMIQNVLRAVRNLFRQTLDRLLAIIAVIRRAGDGDVRPHGIADRHVDEFLPYRRSAGILVFGSELGSVDASRDSFQQIVHHQSHRFALRLGPRVAVLGRVVPRVHRVQRHRRLHINHIRSDAHASGERTYPDLRPNFCRCRLGGYAHVRAHLELFGHLNRLFSLLDGRFQDTLNAS